MANEKTFEFTGTMQKVSSMSVQGGGVQITLRSADTENLSELLEYGMQVVECTLHFPKTYQGNIEPEQDGLGLEE